MTNGDRIRQMSNEELAIVISHQCNYCAFTNQDCRKLYCQDGVKEYLESEVE